MRLGTNGVCESIDDSAEEELLCLPVLCELVCLPVLCAIFAFVGLYMKMKNTSYTQVPNDSIHETYTSVY